ncbi:MAG: hypothetical protein EA403_08770 [Spirochaetaceae bacterium]|nr:MAG: hypothetical protein EA403_08770 [Spirochaetaceae bacterium]
MALQDADLERIGRYVQSQLPGWLEASDRPLPGVQVVEKLTRLEDAILSGQELMRSELHAQRELMEQRFTSMQKQMDERFTAVLREIEVRAAASDKRFESVDKRFDDMQANFARTQWLIGIGFVVLGSLVSMFHLLG